MRGRVAIAALGALAALAPGVGPAAAWRVPNLDWTSLLPPLRGPHNPQPHAVPHCRYGGRRCIGVEIRRLKRLQTRLGCDHRAVFDTTYLELTRTLRRTLRRHPGLIQHPHTCRS
jgi:hypothetical protein